MLRLSCQWETRHEACVFPFSPSCRPSLTISTRTGKGEEEELGARLGNAVDEDKSKDGEKMEMEGMVAATAEEGGEKKADEGASKLRAGLMFRCSQYVSFSLPPFVVRLTPFLVSQMQAYCSLRLSRKR